MALDEESRKALIELETEKAHRFLAQAPVLYELGYLDLTVNRYYYACFHILQAIFLKEGLSAKTHAGLASTCANHFIREGRVDRKYGAVLSRLLQLRQKADYNSKSDISKNEVDQIAPAAVDFIDIIEDLLKE